jgi:hypothetical protein
MIEHYVIRTIKDKVIVIDGSVEDGKVGAMNFGENKWLIQPVYEFIDYFQNECVFMCIDESGVSFFNQNGEKLNGYSYDVAYGFMFGVCAVEKDGMLNVINKYGKLLLDEWCASVSYPIIEEINGQTHYVLSISYDVSDGEYSKFIRYIVENDMLVEII